MSNGRKTLFVISFLIIDLLLVSGIFMIRDMTSRNIIKKEVIALSELQFTEDNFNTDIKSSGEYAIVETAIKKYLDDYATEVQILLSVKDDELLSGLLDSDNYLRDGPLFDESFEYIELTKNNFNYNMDILMNRINEEAIYNYIYNYDVDYDSVELYSNLLVDYNILGKIEEMQEKLKDEKVLIDSYIDSISDVLTYLKNNSNMYNMVDGEIVFYDEVMQNQYNDLFNKTKRIFD